MKDSAHDFPPSRGRRGRGRRPRSARLLLAARRSRPPSWSVGGSFLAARSTRGDPVEGLHRELCEELGVQVELGDEVTGPDDGGWNITDRHVMRLWLARIVTGEPEPWSSTTRSRGCPWGVGSVDWLDGDVRIVEALSDRVAREAV
ncbi:NUDIX domain-containing protein [Oerskovia sp. M15]